MKTYQIFLEIFAFVVIMWNFKELFRLEFQK